MTTEPIDHRTHASAALTDARLIDHAPTAIATALVGIGHALLALTEPPEHQLPRLAEGICGDTLTSIIGGPIARCVLPYQHGGWHQDEAKPPCQWNSLADQAPKKSSLAKRGSTVPALDVPPPGPIGGVSEAQTADSELLGPL